MTEEHEVETADPGRVYLVQITDTHIMADPEDCFDGVDTSATLAEVLKRLVHLRPAPDALLVTGDLVHEPELPAYQRLLRRLETVPFPVFCLPGNHDDPGRMRACLQSARLPVARSLSAAGWCIPLLNTWIPGTHAGRCSREELEYLERLLASGRWSHFLIAMHHPPVSLDSPWMDAMGLENGDEFLDVIDRHPGVRAVVWGHAHQEYEKERGQTRLLGTPSTCVQFKPGADRYIQDPRPPGFRSLFLEADGRVVTQVERISM